MQAIYENIGWLDGNADLKCKMFALSLNYSHISDLKYIKYYPF